VVAGYGDVGKGSAQALRALSAQVWITEIDPICALQAAMEGYRVVTMDYAADKADIFVTATGNFHVITHEHMRKMKDQAIVCNIGHFDNEIDVAGLKQYKWENIKAAGRPCHLPRRQADHPARRGPAGEPRCGTGTELRDVELVLQPGDRADRAVHADGKYPVGVYVLPKHLDEKVARLQLAKLGAQLTELTDAQARYIGVAATGRTSRSITATRRRSAQITGGATGAPRRLRLVQEDFAMRFLLVWALNSLALLTVAYLYPGVQVQDWKAAAVAALVLGLSTCWSSRCWCC